MDWPALVTLSALIVLLIAWRDRILQSISSFKEALKKIEDELSNR